jgi:hypothetical protein
VGFTAPEHTKKQHSEHFSGGTNGNDRITCHTSKSPMGNGLIPWMMPVIGHDLFLPTLISPNKGWREAVLAQREGNSSHKARTAQSGCDWIRAQLPEFDPG